MQIKKLFTDMEAVGDATSEFATNRARAITWVMSLMTLLLVTVAVVPTVWPETFQPLHGIEVDTDPENMLASDEPVRVFHNEAKKEFDLYDMMVVGIVNESDPDGVFNPGTLTRIYALTDRVKDLRWPDPENPDVYHGVVGVDVIAPSNVDDISQAGFGSVAFSWLMEQPPETREQARAMRERALRIPMLKDTMVSSDGQALALYLPLTAKDISWNVREEIQAFVADWPEEEQAIARRAWVGIVTLVLIVTAVWGINRIQINDNPTKWFTESHPIRVADRVLNDHFAGTYTAFLELADTGIRDAIEERTDTAEIPFVWDEVWMTTDRLRAESETFKRPEVLEWVADLQAHMLTEPRVGKVNSLPDIV